MNLISSAILKIQEQYLCPRCKQADAEPWFDRHGIYCGKACEKCAPQLPGQGEMWNYDPQEPVEPEE